MANWFTIRAGSDTSEISLHGDIVDSEVFSSETGADQFLAELKAISSPRIVMSVNSPGGSVFAGLAMFNALRAHPAHITARVEGLSASIATVVMLGADVVEAAEDSFLMLHAPWTMAGGSASDFEQTADTLRKIENQMKGIYARATGQPDDVVASWLDGENWMNAAEGMAAGLIHKIIAPMQIAASADYSRFNTNPLEADMAKPNDPGNRQQLKDELRAELQREEENRKHEISSLFWGPEMEHIRDECLADVNCSADTARERLRGAMAIMADGPVGSGHISGTGLEYSSNYRPRGGLDPEYHNAVADELMMRAGLTVEKPHPAAAHGDLKRHSLSDIAASCLNRFGRNTNGMTKEQVFKAALATSDFPALLADVANKSLAQAYNEAPSVHGQLCNTREVQDFKPTSLVRLSAFDSLLELGEHSEIKHADLMDKAESFKIDSYARMINISRQALINDDASAFTSIPAEMGRAAKRMESSLFWSMLTSNPQMSSGEQFFSAAHKNVGTGAALSLDSLAEAKKLMRVQKSFDGRTYLNLNPTYLVVPPALEVKAEELINSTLHANSNTETVSFIRSLELLVAPELTDTSETAFYLFSSPSVLAACTIAKLAGHGTPSVESNDEWERLASSWRVYFDLAAVPAEPAAAVYNAGA